MAPKRKGSDAQTESSKRVKVSSNDLSNPPITSAGSTSHLKTWAVPVQPKVTKSFKGGVRKLAPPKPSAVSTSRSAHKDGKSVICVSRKTSLGSYLSRCRKVLVEEGNANLHLHAMGAAIPHLLKLAVSLPGILPYAPSDIRMEIRTGTVEVMDELIPDDEDEDIELKTRGKAGLSVRLQVCQTNPNKDS